MTFGPGAEVTSIERLRELPERSVVVDAAGHVWCVQHHRNGETWLSPFSDEYAFMIKADGSAYALGDSPSLPIVFTGIISSVGG